MMATTQALNRRMEELSQQFSSITAAQTREARRKSFQLALDDKSKYPHLSKAASADPSLIEEFESSGATVEDFAARMERRLSVFAPQPAGPSASDANAATDVQSAQDKLASTGSGGVPPIPTPSNETSSSAELHAKLKAEILRKHASQAPTE
jgi:hypothetical protein